MRRWLGISLVWAALLASAVNAQVLEMYRWIDDQGVAHYTNGLRDIPEQFRASATLIRSAEARPPEPPANKASIQFQRRGDLIIVNALLNGKVSVSFVVDTGASYTTISHATAAELGIDLGPSPTTLSFHTANGTINAPLASVGSMQVGGLEIKNITVAIHDVFPDASLAGLLGLNFLGQFRLDIDSQAGLLNLERK